MLQARDTDLGACDVGDTLERALKWQAAMGVVDAMSDSAGIAPASRHERMAGPEKVEHRARQSVSTARDAVPAPAGPVTQARSFADSCKSIGDVVAALEQFEGCALKHTATRLCVHDGNPDARIMFIGEAPGAEEDRQGKPFVGASGRLLDVMLGHIGLHRGNVFITNVIFWRPPGNRAPTADEIAVCQPFLERQIQILDPAIIVFVGGTAAKALLNRKEGVTRLRGRWYDYLIQGTDRAVPSMVTFHPAYLLRQPLQKRQCWRDLLSIRQKIDYLGIDLFKEGVAKPA
jgi:DNA polymerase